jgi:hypothetical protein
MFDALILKIFSKISQELKLVSLQIISTLVSFYVTIHIASSIDPSVYALLGINAIILNSVLIFSTTGIETHAIRSLLGILRKNELESAQTLVTNSIIYRFIASFLTLIPISVFIYFISVSKYNGGYFFQFFIMGVGSIIFAVNDTISLLLKSLNNYVAASMNSAILTVFGKISGLWVFNNYGFNTFLIFNIIFPSIMILPFIKPLLPYLNFRKSIEFKGFVNNYRENSHYTLSSFVTFFSAIFDQIVVSIIFIPEILGVFTLCKNIIQMINTFFGNLFDPIIQKMVANSENNVLFQSELSRVWIRKKNMICLYLFGSPLLFLVDDSLKVLGIEKYPNLDIYIYVIYFSFLLDLIYRAERGMILMFFKSKYYLKYHFVTAVINLFFITVFSFLDEKFILFYLFSSNFLILLYTNFLYKKYHL